MELSQKLAVQTLQIHHTTKINQIFMYRLELKKYRLKLRKPLTI